MFYDQSNLRVPFAVRARRNFVIAAALFAACFLFNVAGVRAATFVVNSTVDANDINPGDGICETVAGSGICTLRAAITEANALAGDDIITLPAGTYTQTLVGVDDANASGDLDITSNITINGAGSGSTIIQANDTAGTAVERVVHFPVVGVTVILDDVTIRNGRQSATGAADSGGGVRVDSAGDSITFNNCAISNNFSGYGGGGILIKNAASVTLNGTTVNANKFNGGNTSVDDGGGGGVLLNGGGTLIAANSTISSNTVVSNVSPYGGGIENFGGTVVLTNSIISSNTVSTAGRDSYGGGIDSGGTVTITNSTISSNTATSSGIADAIGGAISHFDGTMNITNSTISGNTATGTGTGIGITAGIINFATLTLTNSTVSGNIAASRSGIYTYADTIAAMTTITQSAIVNNISTSGGGGGVSNVSSSQETATTNINNSTIGGNMAAGSGGGVNNFKGSSGAAIVNINNSTVAGNAANTDNTGTDNGGGVANIRGNGAGTVIVNLQNSIIANNTVGIGGANPDIFGFVKSSGYNHVEHYNDNPFALTLGDVSGSDPGLTPLALNGGTTLNYKPGANSPVLDAIPVGTNGCGTTPFNVDQRNKTRPTDSDNNGTAACEKGSVEVIAPTASAVFIGGRVMSLGGKRGLANAVVKMTDAVGTTRMAQSNGFGYFQFDNVEAGQTYIIGISSKRYQFQTQVISIIGDLSDLNFVPMY